MLSSFSNDPCQPGSRSPVGSAVSLLITNSSPKSDSESSSSLGVAVDPAWTRLIDIEAFVPFAGDQPLPASMWVSAEMHTRSGT